MVIVWIAVLELGNVLFTAKFTYLIVACNFRYIEQPKRDVIKEDFLTSGSYEIEVMSKKYPATLYIKSPFDPSHQRLYGRYEHQFQEQTHFED